jgi:uncharacterized damage-inducible protein DinB
MTALTDEELQAWVERSSSGWKQLLASHPEILALPCDIRECHTVAELLQHIVAVELRYAERLRDLPQTDYTSIPFGTTEEIYATHDRAMELWREAQADSSTDWEEQLVFVTRSAGTLQASRRVVLVHALMHSIRHYAQLATLVRQHGIQPDWMMDYLGMGATQIA